MDIPGLLNRQELDACRPIDEQLKLILMILNYQRSKKDVRVTWLT
jgi:hypothetical protein